VTRRLRRARALGEAERSYLSEVVVRLEAALEREVAGIWLFGSGALGDFDPRRSDLDVQVVVRSRLPMTARRALAAELSHDSLHCPARGLELVLYAQEDLHGDRGPVFQMNLNTGERIEQRLEFKPDPSEWFWFALDVAIGRGHGLALIGPAPADIFPVPSDNVVVRAALAALDWFRCHDGDGVATVLAACRAWAWASEGRWLSKTEAGEWAERRLADPTPVEKAFARRRDRRAPDVSSAERAVLLQRTQDALEQHGTHASEPRPG
jgi:predicted nucleotidyltransferase